MSQNQQPPSQHQALFFLLSKRFSLYLTAFITLICLVACLLQRGSLLTIYILCPVMVAVFTLWGIHAMQQVLNTFLIRRYGARTQGIVLRMKTEPNIMNGGTDRGALVEYTTHKGVKQQWFYYNNMPEGRSVTVLYNPYAPDQVMLEKPLSTLDKVFLAFGPLFVALGFFGCVILFFWLLFTGP